MTQAPDPSTTEQVIGHLTHVSVVLIMFLVASLIDAFGQSLGATLSTVILAGVLVVASWLKRARESAPDEQAQRVGWLESAAVGTVLAALINLLIADSYWATYLRITVVVILLALLAARSFLTDTQVPAKVRQILINMSILTYATVFMLLFLELIFRVFVVRSDNFAFTLAQLNWYDRYWHPVNSSGYRDDEWTPADLEDHTTILVLGDSFAAGHGVRRVDDRFSNVLADRLGEDYVVMTAGVLGADTTAELEALEAYPYTPDIVILAYYINDIQDRAGDYDVLVKGYVPQLPDTLSLLVHRSYLANFVYYQAIRLPFLQAEQTYYDSMLQAFHTPEIWSAHQDDLLDIYAWTQANGAELWVVIFPNLVRPEETRFITDMVEETFAQQGVPALNLTDLIVTVPPRRRVVNNVDFHPSAYVHHLVGDALYDMVVQLDDTSESD